VIIDSLNTATARPIDTKTGRTGIFKEPRTGPVRIAALGLVGDTICDTDHHGGVDQAVYVYTRPDLAWWSAGLGRELAPGTFGENILLSDLESAGIRVGDRFAAGSAVLEVTSPRIPCETLSERMGERTFAKRFMRACRPGVYCRVIQEGDVSAGMPVDYQPSGTSQVTIGEYMRAYPMRDVSAEFRARLLAAPVHYKTLQELARGARP
jgi:MOSC domain-containing protein YiiM